MFLLLQGNIDTKTLSTDSPYKRGQRFNGLCYGFHKALISYPVILGKFLASNHFIIFVYIIYQAQWTQEIQHRYSILTVWQLYLYALWALMIFKFKILVTLTDHRSHSDAQWTSILISSSYRTHYWWWHSGYIMILGA